MPTWLTDRPYLNAAATIAALLVALLVSSRHRDSGESGVRQRSRRVVASVFGVLTIAGLLAAQFAGRELWICVLAFIPAGLVLYQGLSVAIFKNDRFFEEQPRFAAPAGSRAFLQPLMNAAWSEDQRYYSVPSLALRFGLPALLLATVALTAAHCLVAKDFCDQLFAKLPRPDQDRVISGARLGLCGAYIYVVMYLGNRSFRSDVTPGAALWSAVTLAVGPVFAAVLVFVAKPSADDRWGAQIVPFAAGFSLRYVANVVEVAIRRLMGGATENTSRSVPLSQLRGVSKDVEQRLAEEGIENVAELAMAHPHRLRRNTCYDKRQIVGWIDQALLMTYLPLAWQTLEAEGITGAIDLVWYVNMKTRADTKTNSGTAGDKPLQNVEHTIEAPHEFLPPVPDTVNKLALRNKLDPNSLWEAMLRMHADEQVQMNWALYQLDDRETEGSRKLQPDAKSEPARSTDAPAV